MNVVKYQLHIRYIVLGIEEAHHAYSKGGSTYTADELFEHLVDTAILLYVDLKRKGKLPTMASLKLPCHTNMATLGTMSELGNGIYKQIEIGKARPRKDAQYERGGKEEIGEGYR